MKNNTVVLAVDRAEAQLGKAVCKLADHYKQNIDAICLVSEEFKNTPAYKGDETDGLFKEIFCDFNNQAELKKILSTIAEKSQIIMHCRMEEAIKDYRKIIPLLPKDTLVQSSESLRLTTEKYLMREAMSKQFPEIIPKFIKVYELEEFEESLIADFKLPVIVKPNGLHSSFFVKKCFSVEEVVSALANAFEGLDAVYKREYGTGSPCMLIEEFISGDMYSIDVYIDDNENKYYLQPVGVTIAAQLGLDGYYGYQYDLPANLSKYDINAANECCAKAISSVKLKNSVAHIELFKTQDGWKIIEIGPRIGGYRQELYFEAFGIDHYLNDLMLHAGFEPDIKPKWHKYASGLTLYADKEGTITAISGIEESERIDSVKWIGLDANVGDKAVFNSNGGQLLAIVVTSNNDKQQLIRDNKKVRETINFLVK